LQGAQGAIIVGDLSRQETIDHIQKHIELFSSVNPKVGNILVGLNKSDLLDQESLEKCYQQDFFCQQNQVIAIYTTSAKTGENVNQIFHDLACSLYPTFCT
jgi:signal recognition particle receptor subunit beta